MLRIDHVSKTYKRGKKKALQDINLHIQQGEFTALLGQNGAGKTTLINILGGNVHKSAGTVTIGDYDLDQNPLEIKRILSIVPQEIGNDFNFTLEEMLQKQSGYFGIKENEQYIDELLTALSLQDKRKVTLRELSGGMKRRFLIAKALIHKPQLLILDEPTAGVDIELRQTMYDFLNKLHSQGTTIILTTHYIEEAEKLCKRIVVIDQGQIIADQPKEELMKVFTQYATVEFELDHGILPIEIEFLKEFHPEIKEKRKLCLRVPKEDLARLMKMVSDEGMKFTDMTVNKPKLEEIYLNLIRQDKEGKDANVL